MHYAYGKNFTSFMRTSTVADILIDD